MAYCRAVASSHSLCQQKSAGSGLTSKFLPPVDTDLPVLPEQEKNHEIHHEFWGKASTSCLPHQSRSRRAYGIFRAVQLCVDNLFRMHLREFLTVLQCSQDGVTLLGNCGISEARRSQGSQGARDIVPWSKFHDRSGPLRHGGADPTSFAFLCRLRQLGLQYIA